MMPPAAGSRQVGVDGERCPDPATTTAPSVMAIAATWAQTTSTSVALVRTSTVWSTAPAAIITVRRWHLDLRRASRVVTMIR